MLTALHRRFARYAGSPLFAFLVGILVLCLAAFRWRAGVLGDRQTPDGTRTGYTDQFVADFLNGLDASQRRMYAATELSLDVIFPLALGALFACAFSRLYRAPHRWVLLAPLALVCADLLENATLAYLALSHTPGEGPSPLGSLAAGFTAAKYLAIAVSTALLLAGFVAAILRRRRGAASTTPGPEEPAASEPPILPVELEKVLEDELNYIRHHRHPGRQPGHVRSHLVGLALSGGGIRSATTNLGTLQALSRMDVLPMVDYLSTVSGGGYVGACMSSLLSMNDQSEPGAADPREAISFKRGYGTRFSTAWARFPFRARGFKEWPPVGAELVGHLRTHGNFLIARWGLLRRDTMRGIGSVLPGVLYHVLIFLLTMFAVSSFYVSVTRSMVGGLDSVLGDEAARARRGAEWAARARGDTARAPLASGGKVVRTITAPCPAGEPGCREIRSATYAQPGIGDRAARNARALRAALLAPSPEGEGWTLAPGAVRPLRTAVLLAAVWSVLAFLVVFLAVATYRPHEAAALYRPRRGESADEAFENWTLRCLVGATLAGAIAVTAVLCTGTNDDLVPERALVLLVVPLALFATLWVVSLFLSALALPTVWGERARWLRHLWTRRMRSLWGAYQGAALYGMLGALVFSLLPLLIYAVSDHTGSLGVGAALSMAATRMLTRRGGPENARRVLPPMLRNALLAAAVTALLLLVALFFAALVVRWYPQTGSGYAVAAAAAGALLLLSFMADHNRLSPHYFYRDRLAETYLLSELPDVEGRMRLFRDAMEMPLKSLHGRAAGGAQGWRNTAPYQLMTAAINLAGSRDLTRRDRKSGYWLFSKYYCGSVHTGFLRTADYRGGETKLARAVAISGAAAGPAVGGDTFFAKAFAAVLFNVRLGYWLENPQRQGSRRKAWVFWPLYLWRELTMNTTDKTPLVNLSDGGYTGDNLGIYPLMQRRCKVIIVCDAERDPNLTFGSLSEALRHAYVDMGIDVDIDLTMIRPDPGTGLSRSHCAVGRIRYPDRPDQASYLVYMKNSLTGDEPAPMQNYISGHPGFPHESTADFFFSDAQFESYRALGVHMTEHTFGRWAVSSWLNDARAGHAPNP